MNQQTRQRNEDQYVMPVEASRRGAHRARVSPLLGALPFVAVAVVVVGVVFLAWAVFGGNGGGSTTTEPAGVSSTAQASKGGTGQASQPAQQSSSKPAKQPSGQTKTSAAPSKTTAAPAGGVDKSLQIVVRNSTTTKGLAKGAADKLRAKGWTINGIPDNYKPTIPSTVFYADDSQKASAEAVAKVLSIALVKADPTMAAKGITVVLGSDYQR